MVAVTDPITSTFFRIPNIRVMDPRYDLDEIANLIEVCFSATMDEDGYAYLRQMRKSAQEARILRWMTSYADENPLPVSGLVWMDGNKIIGNLSLIPMQKDNQKIFLIANVAVLPEYRGKGISKELTYAALEYTQKQGVASTWLQVRNDNPVAYTLYRETGFIERSRRTTWHAKVQPGYYELEPGLAITTTFPSDWETQYRMLLRIYHREVIWNLPVNLPSLRTNWMNQISKIIYGEKIRGFALRANNQFLGSVTWEAAKTWADNLWPACDAANQDLVLRNLLPHVLSSIRSSRPQAVNYPDGQAEGTFVNAGFHKHVTLVWMEARLSSSVPLQSI